MFSPETDEVAVAQYSRVPGPMTAARRLAAAAALHDHG
jgi:hypothetical protein